MVRSEVEFCKSKDFPSHCAAVWTQLAIRLVINMLVLMMLLLMKLRLMLMLITTRHFSDHLDLDDHNQPDPAHNFFNRESGSGKWMANSVHCLAIIRNRRKDIAFSTTPNLPVFWQEIIIVPVLILYFGQWGHWAIERMSNWAMGIGYKSKVAGYPCYLPVV